MLEAGVCLRATARWSGNQIEVDGDIQYNTQAHSMGTNIIEIDGTTHECGSNTDHTKLVVLV